MATHGHRSMLLCIRITAVVSPPTNNYAYPLGVRHLNSVPLGLIRRAECPKGAVLGTHRFIHHATGLTKSHHWNSVRRAFHRRVMKKDATIEALSGGQVLKSHEVASCGQGLARVSGEDMRFRPTSDPTRTVRRLTYDVDRKGAD